MEHESDGDSNCYWRARLSHQRIVTEAGGLGKKKKTIVDNPNQSIFKVSEITKKSPGNFQRLAVTRTAEENHSLTQMRRILK